MGPGDMLKTSFTIFRAFGIPVEINVTWFIIFALVSWSLVTLYFPSNYPDMSVASYWVMGVAAALMLFASVVLHELSHSYVARLHGVPIRRITLFLFGGVSQMERETERPETEMKIAIAGPAMSFALMFVFFLIYLAVGAGGEGGGVAPVFRYLAIVNGMLGAFNLIPGFPLDGGRLLRAAIWKGTGNLKKATYVASRVGSVVGIAFIVLGFFAVFWGLFIFGFWIVLIGFFLRQASSAGYLHVVVENALKGYKARDVMKRGAVTVSGDISIQVLVDEFVFKYHLDCYPVVEPGGFAGVVAVRDIKSMPRRLWRTTLVRDVMRSDLERLSVGLDDDLAGVLRSTIRERCGTLPVVEDGKVVGTVSRNDIVDAMKVLADVRE
jgi:Zn-dependent protease/predicted transcriptional regulator